MYIICIIIKRLSKVKLVNPCIEIYHFETIISIHLYSFLVTNGNPVRKNKDIKSKTTPKLVFFRNSTKRLP